MIGCRMALLPMKYFSLHLGAPYESTCIWNGIIEKMEGWLEEAIFVKGRWIDIDQMYFVQIYPHTIYLCFLFQGVWLIGFRNFKEIYFILFLFLWGCIYEEFKFHLVKW